MAILTPDRCGTCDLKAPYRHKCFVCRRRFAKLSSWRWHASCYVFQRPTGQTAEKEVVLMAKKKALKKGKKLEATKNLSGKRQWLT